MSDKALRKGFELLDTRVENKNVSVLYSRIFKSLGLGTTSSLWSFWEAVKENQRLRRVKELKPVQKAELPGADTAPDQNVSGFDIEYIEEDPERQIKFAELDCGKFILGDDTICAFDHDGLNVFVACREDDLVVVYNAGDLFSELLCNELRLQFANAVVVHEGQSATMQMMSNGVQSALAALLGLGYIIIPGRQGADWYVSITSRAGRTCTLPVPFLSALVSRLLKSNLAGLRDPEWVFDRLCKHDLGSEQTV